jgi:hypothetical protein
LAKLVPTFADRGCDVVSVTDPYGRILGFIWRYGNKRRVEYHWGTQNKFVTNKATAQTGGNFRVGPQTANCVARYPNTTRHCVLYIHPLPMLKIKISPQTNPPNVTS